MGRKPTAIEQIAIDQCNASVARIKRETEATVGAHPAKVHFARMLQKQMLVRARVDHSETDYLLDNFVINPFEERNKK